jgi:GNAT superfamily N-acetyltransferase
VKTEIIKTRILTERQIRQINQLWNDEFPVKLKGRFGILLDGVSNFEHYYIAEKNDAVIAWAVIFEKDNELRFSLIVHSSHKGKGFGTALVNKLKENHSHFYGWVIDHNQNLRSKWPEICFPPILLSEKRFRAGAGFADR